MIKSGSVRFAHVTYYADHLHDQDALSMDEIVELGPDIRTATGIVLVDDDTKIIIANWTVKINPIEEGLASRLYDFVAVINKASIISVEELEIKPKE